MSDEICGSVTLLMFFLGTVFGVVVMSGMMLIGVPATWSFAVVLAAALIATIVEATSE